MDKVLKAANRKLYLYLIAFVVIAIGWRTGEYVNQQLTELQIKQAPRVDRNTATLDAKSFYPVWVKQSVAVAAEHVDSEVDSLFRDREIQQPEIKPVEVVEPDYGEIFRQSVAINGVADDGVFVNGRFYKVGAKMDEVAMQSASGAMIIPRVESLKQGRVFFRVGKDRISFLFGVQR